MENHMSYQDSVKEALVIALTELMHEKNMSQITIQELVKKAGVGRSSFYRHFDSKEDILCYRINQLIDTSKLNLNPYNEDHLKSYIISQFRLWKENKDFILVLKQNDLLYLLFKQTSLSVKNNIAAFHLYKNPYQAVFFSSAAMGVIIQWIENNFKESETELTEMFIYLMSGQHMQR